MANCESLFSLEVVVESVEKVVVCCTKPAIAFRLLDFPTLVIRAEENKREKENSYGLTVYSFTSGKSCLFKMTKEVLRSRLDNTPLYVMLMDISSRKTQLLASTTISLMTCFRRVLESMGRNGVDIPAVQSEQGVFELYNLMGTPVAMVKLHYRIFSLGGTISGHMQCIRNAELPPNVQTIKEKALSDHCQEKYVKKGLETAMVNNDLPKEKGAVKSGSTLKLEAETQTDIYNQKQFMVEEYCDVHVASDAKLTDCKENVNIKRPPPLFYHSKATAVDPKPYFIQDGTRLVKKNTEDVRVIPKKHCQDISVQTSEAGLTEGPNEAPNLPVINALMTELTLAKQNLNGTAAPLLHSSFKNNETQPPSKHGKKTVSSAVLASTRKSAHKADCSTGIGISSLYKNNTQNVKFQQATSKGVLIHRNLIKPKKTILKYGLTRTQKLREAMNKNITSCTTKTKRPLQRIKDQDEHEKTKLVNMNKITNEFGCQVALEGNVRENMDKNVTQKSKEVGVQVMICDSKEPVDIVRDNSLLVPHAANSENTGCPTADEKDNSIQDHDILAYQENFSPPSQEELSGHPIKSQEPNTVTLGSVQPTFSSVSPTLAKNNTGVGTQQHSLLSEEGGTMFVSLLRSSENGDLVSRPVVDLSETVNSNFDHSYSESFDSLADEGTESNLSDTNV